MRARAPNLGLIVSAMGGGLELPWDAGEWRRLPGVDGGTRYTKAWRSRLVGSRESLVATLEWVMPIKGSPFKGSPAVAIDGRLGTVIGFRWLGREVVELELIPYQQHGPPAEAA